MDRLVLDTSALMEHNNIIEKFYKEYNIIIPIVVIEELDNLKTNRDYYKSSKARQAIKQIEKNKNIVKFDLQRRLAGELTRNYAVENTYNMNDDVIVTSALINTANLCTCDLNLKIKANAIGVNTIDFPKDSLYRGYKRILVSDEELAYIYSNKNDNIYNLNINEYILIYQDNNCVDYLKWTKDGYAKVSYKTLKTKHFGNIKAKDEYQMCALDSLEHNEVTVLYGRAGSGKSQLSLAYLIRQLEQGDISKIYIVYSYDTLRGAKTLGYEKGTHEEKILMTGSVGNILATKFGSIDAVKALMLQDQLEIIPTANIRGVEFKSDSALYVTEAQNLDVYTMKTIIQRCCAGCKQIYEGDIIEQTDVNISQSGIERMLDVFKGNEKFGCIKLKNNYRSDITTLADKM